MTVSTASREKGLSAVRLTLRNTLGWAACTRSDISTIHGKAIRMNGKLSLAHACHEFRVPSQEEQATSRKRSICPTGFR